MPPYVVSVGDYSPELKGEEIAITSRYASTSQPSVYLLSLTGKVLKVIQVPGKNRANYQREFKLFTKTGGKVDELFVQNLTAKWAFRLLPQEETTPVDFHASAIGSRLFDTAYSDRDFNL